MRSVVLNQFFHRLEIRCTHSKPHTSDDNAFIESLFSVLKGRASFPEYFKDIIQARAYVQALVQWYNTKHMHSKLGYLTPMEVEQGKADEIQARRNEVIEKARALRPQRFGNRKLYLRVPKVVRLVFHDTVSYG
jgi:hypothetical protein